MLRGAGEKEMEVDSEYYLLVCIVVHLLFKNLIHFMVINLKRRNLKTKYT